MSRPRASSLAVIALVGALVDALVGASSLHAQQARPALSAGRVTAEAVVGAYAGIGGFIVGRYVGERAAEMMGATSEDTQRRLGFTAGVIAGGLTTAGSVYGIGSVGNQTGDFATTYLGTGVGFAAAWGLSRALLGPSARPDQHTAGRWAVANLIAFLPAIGGTIGFNSTRRAR